MIVLIIYVTKYGCSKKCVELSLIETTVTLIAQLYSSVTPDNIFTPVPVAIVSFPLIGTILVGGISNGIINNLAIPVTAETRLLLVLSATASEVTLINSIIGCASAGLTIQ